MADGRGRGRRRAGVRGGEGRADPRVEQVVICSPDKDLAQCVRGTRVVQLDRVRKTWRDEAGVVAKFGVPPASIPDYLALVGDSADGFPGLPGWGAKSAAAVLARFGHIDAIPDDHRAWGVNVARAASLARDADLALATRDVLARLFRQLATLRTDVPVFESVDDPGVARTHAGVEGPPGNQQQGISHGRGAGASREPA
jgi:5'-3' exonuclease